MSKKPQLSLLTVGMSIAALVLASTSSLAAGYKAENYKGEVYKGEAPCPVEPSLKDGFYVGAQVGYDMYRVKNEIDVVDGDGDVLSTNPTLSAHGWAGGLFLGYGKYLDQFYLGGEIFGNGSGAKSSSDTDVGTAAGELLSVDTDIKIKSEYGVSLLPGIKVNNTSLLYLRVGYNWAKLDHDVDATGIPASGIPYSLSDDESSTVHGWSGGVGIETLLADNFSVRAEYTYTKYNNASNGDDDDFATLGTAAVASDLDHLADNQFMLALVYHIS